MTVDIKPEWVMYQPVKGRSHKDLTPYLVHYQSRWRRVLKGPGGMYVHVHKVRVTVTFDTSLYPQGD